jgi:hypothetical protein
MNEGVGTPGKLLSDYGRACQVKDYLGAVNIDEGQALILGDMPLETSVFKHATGSPIIVRLFYADPDADIPRMLHRVSDTSFDDPEESISFDVTSGRLVIFDSAFAGAEPEKKNLTFGCAPGRYRILSKVVNPDRRTSMLLHRFFITM